MIVQSNLGPIHTNSELHINNFSLAYTVCKKTAKYGDAFSKYSSTRDVFYNRREVDLMKTATVNAYIMHIFGKIELLSIHATLNYFKIHYFNAF